LSTSSVNFHHWIARDPLSVQVLKIVDKVKNTASTLLIQGESGTGKDLLASVIHYSSDRRDQPFLRIDCSSIPAGLIESELFGYEKGAFTGAHARKLGKLEFAGKGTIVLDEIASLELDTQAKLLRVIEEKQFARLGGHIAIAVNARLIALSRERLETLVSSRAFREDLFFRLNVVPIHLAPLRERPDDISALAEFWLNSAREKYAKPKLRMEASVVNALRRYAFPGNVRELRNLLDRLVMMADDDLITDVHLPAAVRQSQELKAARPSLEQLEKAYIEEILQLTRGKKGRAASILGISRKTLLEKRKRYGLMD
jgi:transcriptional regulator with PAS, ATPase and Fis domain